MVKRPLIITIGIVVILLVLGLWVYLLLFGAPDNSDDVFTNLGFEVNQREAVIIEPVAEADYTVDISSGLQQLTTRPVAGFIATAVAGSSLVRYVEQGTGHIYEIDLQTGEENLISRTTLPRVRKAVFSNNGQSVALTSFTGYNLDTFAGEINTEKQTIEGESLVPNAKNLAWFDDETVLYTLESEAEQIGYAYDLSLSELREQFRVPFKDTTTIWSDKTYLFNKPADSLIGYLYEISSGSYQSTGILGFGLTAEVGIDYIGYSHLKDRVSTSVFVDRNTGETFVSPIMLIPEKCVFAASSTGQVWCAAPISPDNETLSLSDWYQGKISSTDFLWQISVEASVGTLILDLKETSGRPIDVTDLAINENDSVLVFKNKFDNTLWKFDLK